jgi:hypothetical protein
MMMREPRPRWVKKTATINYAIVGAILLFILWTTFFR